MKDSWAAARKSTGEDNDMLRYEGPLLEGDHAAFWTGQAPGTVDGENKGTMSGAEAGWAHTDGKKQQVRKKQLKAGGRIALGVRGHQEMDCYNQDVKLEQDALQSKPYMEFLGDPAQQKLAQGGGRVWGVYNNRAAQPDREGPCVDSQGRNRCKNELGKKSRHRSWKSRGSGRNISHEEDLSKAHDSDWKTVGDIGYLPGDQCREGGETFHCGALPGFL